MYLVVFLSALAVDLVPVIAPPAWVAMVFLQIKFGLDPWGVLAAGVPGSTLGRYLLSRYIPKISKKFITQQKKEELEYLGARLDHHVWRTWALVFLYTLTPLSTTALFTAAGMARIKPMQLIPPFFVGKFISDAVMVFGSHYAAGEASDLLHGTLNWKTIATGITGLILVAGIFFIDWQTLLARKQLRFNFNIWK